MNLHDKLKRLAEIIPNISPGKGKLPVSSDDAEFISLANPQTVQELLKLVDIVVSLCYIRGYLLNTGRIAAQASLDAAWEKAEQWLREAKQVPRHPLIEGLRGSLTNVLYDNTSSLQEREAEVESVLDLISHKLGSALPEVAPR